MDLRAIATLPVAFFLVACAANNAAVRAPEITPTERLLAQPLPAGIVETTIALGSSGSSGGNASTSLLWVVASDTREYVYAVANCHEARQTEDDRENLASAECDGQRYVVRRVDDRLQLVRDGDMRASFTVPSGWRVRTRSATP